MKKLFPLMALAVVIAFGSCKNGQTENEQKKDEKTAEEKVYTPEKFISECDSLVGKEIELKGIVAHICKHGGKKCRIEGEKEGSVVMVMAGEKIGSFDVELMNTNIIVKGIVKESRTTKAAIEEMEQKAKEEASKCEDGGNNEHCSHSMANINKMKKWMEDNNKDYFPQYFIEGQSFKKAE